MDKRKAIAAYRSGLISLQECAQVLGVDNVRLVGLIRDAGTPNITVSPKQSVRS